MISRGGGMAGKQNNIEVTVRPTKKTLNMIKELYSFKINRLIRDVKDRKSVV